MEAPPARTAGRDPRGRSPALENTAGHRHTAPVGHLPKATACMKHMPKERRPNRSVSAGQGTRRGRQMQGRVRGKTGALRGGFACPAGGGGAGQWLWGSAGRRNRTPEGKRWGHPVNGPSSPQWTSRSESGVWRDGSSRSWQSGLNNPGSYWKPSRFCSLRCPLGTIPCSQMGTRGTERTGAASPPGCGGAWPDQPLGPLMPSPTPLCSLLLCGSQSLGQHPFWNVLEAPGPGFPHCWGPTVHSRAPLTPSPCFHSDNKRRIIPLHPN